MCQSDALEAVSTMKILELKRAFDFDQDGAPLIGVHIVFGDENHFDKRYYKTLTFDYLQVTTEEVEDLTAVEWQHKLKTLDLEQLKNDAGLLQDLYPEFDPNEYTQCKPNPDAEDNRHDVFLKQRSLIVLEPALLEDVEFTKSYIQTELRVCELLRKFPHPNLAKYLGCRVQAKLVTGIYYERYNKDVQDDRAEPLHVHKYIEDIRKGIEHLHSLGFCHNDISPYNIMLKDDDSAVIIDFDACLPTGEKTIKEACTGFSRDAGVSEEENDWFGLQQIEKWMHEWNKHSWHTKSIS